jgi:competence protein ComEC
VSTTEEIIWLIYIFPISGSSTAALDWVRMRLRDIHKSPSRTLAILLAVFCFGVLLYNLLPHQSLSIADVPSSSIRISGRVDAQVERRIDGQRVVLDDVSFVDDPQEGRLLVWMQLYPEIAYGDELVFNCRVERPEAFQGFAYDTYLATQGIYAVCYSPQYIDVHASTDTSFLGVIVSIKSFATDTLRNILPEPHASFLSGLLFGGSSALSNDLKNDFRATGTAHILAASGYNVSMFSVMLLSVLLSSPLGRRRALVLTTLLLVAYVIVAGASAAVVRAGLMGFVVVLGKWISRKAYLLNVMLLTASVMLLFHPLLLLYDVGFQLSFVATIAIVALTDSWSKRLECVPDVLGMRAAFAGSLAAIVFTLPIVLWHFGTISLVSPFANLLVLPLVPFAMATAGVGLLVGTLSVSAGIVFSLPAWALSNVLLHVIDAYGSIPFAFTQVAHARLVAVLVAALLFFFWFKDRYVPSRT